MVAQMNILFLSIVDIPQGTIADSGIYTDLLREFKANGHDVYVACGHEKRFGYLENLLSMDEGIHVLHVPVGNITKTDYLKKGINTVKLPKQFYKAIIHYYNRIQFDLIIYATPPVTLCSTVKRLKHSFNANTFLLLKDMWPEGISSLGVIKKNGIIYRYFSAKEKAMYKVSDNIGCMSEACVRYLYKHHPQIPKTSIVVCPNSSSPIDLSLSPEEKHKCRIDFGLPIEKKLIVYGGNLGKAQGVDFLIKCLESHEIDDVGFVIIGSGLERYKIEEYIERDKPQNVFLFNSMEKNAYRHVMASCDVGLLLLNSKLTVPNTPSRLLDYMQAKLPVIGCVDYVTDVGEIIENGSFGWKCYSDDEKHFISIVKSISRSDDNLRLYGENGFKFFLNNYSVGKTYETIINANYSRMPEPHGSAS